MADMDHQPLISVIIPTYNRERYLLEAVQSVLSQTYSNIELIVIDDGSTDQSHQMIGNVKDKRLEYYKVEHSGHISTVRNIGLSKCRGKYIAFLDSDDIWHSCKLEKQLKYLIKAKAQAIISSYYVLNEDGTIGNKLLCKYSGENESQFILQNLLMNTISIYISTLMIHRSVLKEVERFSTTTSISEVDFIGRILTHCRMTIYTDSLVTIRKHEANISRQTAIQELFKEKFIMIHGLHNRGDISRNTYKKARLYHIYSYLIQGKHELSLTEKFNLFVDCHKIKPLALRHVFVLVKSLI